MYTYMYVCIYVCKSPCMCWPFAQVERGRAVAEVARASLAQARMGLDSVATGLRHALPQESIG